MYLDELSGTLPVRLPTNHSTPCVAKKPPKFYVVPHFRCISDVSSLHLKNKNLILTIAEQNESFDCSRGK